MPKRLKETGKSLLIVLLLCSAVLLAGKTELFKNFIDVVPFLSGISRFFRPESDRTVTGESKPVVSSAAAPLYAVVTSKYGDHCGIKYDNTALNTFYSRVIGILGDALSNSSPPSEIEEEEWRFALSSVGVFMDYYNPMPLSALLKSRDSKITSDLSTAKVRRICIAAIQNSNRVYIYYIDESSGNYYSALTNINYSLLSSYAAEYIPNDAKFAFELSSEYSVLDPYTVLLETTKPLTVNVSNPIGLKLSKEQVMDQFGINSRLSSQLFETANFTSFITEHFTLRVNSDGTAVYKVTGINSGSILKVKSAASKPTDYEILESARSLVASTLGTTCGNGTTLLLSSLAYNAEEKAWNVCFDYYINGIPVKLSSAPHAAVITISGGYIVAASLNYRSYSLSTAAENILPERQAAVLVSGGAEPLLFYSDDGGGGALKLAWTER